MEDIANPGLCAHDSSIVSSLEGMTEVRSWGKHDREFREGRQNGNEEGTIDR